MSPLRKTPMYVSQLLHACVSSKECTKTLNNKSNYFEVISFLVNAVEWQMKIQSNTCTDQTFEKKTF